jgi:ribosome-associated protein
LSLAEKARAALDAKKGQNMVLLDVRESSGITDYCLIVSGSSAPHLKALANGVQRALKEDGVSSYRKAGAPQSGWMVLDYLDLIIHIFSREAREYYALEDLWASAPRLAPGDRRQ